MYKSDELVRAVRDELAKWLESLDVTDDITAADQLTIKLCDKLHGPWALYFPSEDKARKALGWETRDESIRRAYNTGKVTLTHLAVQFELSERHLRRIIFTDE